MMDVLSYESNGYKTIFVSRDIWGVNAWFICVPPMQCCGRAGSASMDTDYVEYVSAHGYSLHFSGFTNEYIVWIVLSLFYLNTIVNRITNHILSVQLKIINVIWILWYDMTLMYFTCLCSIWYTTGTRSLNWDFNSITKIANIQLNSEVISYMLDIVTLFSIVV